jgi:hypothetical protein
MSLIERKCNCYNVEVLIAMTYIIPI